MHPTISDDGNLNGVADCLDPAGTLVPAGPRVRVRRNTARITMDSYSSVSYQIRYRQIGARRWRRKNSTSNVKTLKRLLNGQYAVYYRIRAGSTATRWSRKRKFRIR